MRKKKRTPRPRTKTKEQVLEKHADRLLKQDEKNQKLKEKSISINPFKLFD